MAINFNNLNQGRAGIIGLDNVIAQPSIAPSQQAGLLELITPGFMKSDEQKALEQIQDLREQENKITGGVGASKDVMQNLEMLNPDKFNKIKEIQKQIEELKKQFPDDTAVQEASLTNQFGFPLMASLDTSGVSKAIERAKEREALDIRKFMPGSIPGSVALSTTTTDPMDIREQNRLGNLAVDEILGDRAVTFDAPYMSTALKMVPKPTFGQRLSSGINQLKTNLGTGFNQVKSDIGSFLGSGGVTGILARGLGGILSAFLPKETPIDKFNKQFSVQNLGGDPYGYYNDLRAGNLTGQDPFGVNTVSRFGDYQKHYRDYLDAFNNQTKFKGLYTPKKTSKFAQDKADFAREVLGLKKTSSNITGTPLIVSGSVFEQDKGRDDDRGSTGSTGGGGFGAADFGPGDDEFGAL
tara:strand:- start:411 stop:1643 length:1233 start_codon:yes stop_codon:yes gene_type:complete